MSEKWETFQGRVAEVRGRIEAACRRAGRSPEEVTLMAVTKTHPVEAAAWAARAGIHSVGENRVREAVDKITAAPDLPVRWELIGHLQTNKARAAATYFQRIQSVDSPKLATRLDRMAGELGKVLPVLLQINAGEDPNKFGAVGGEAMRLAEEALRLPHLRVEGLMTIAPLEGGRETARRAFAHLRELRDRMRTELGADLSELSMGMTGDLEEAVAEGSTLLRVGTALFGER